MTEPNPDALALVAALTTRSQTIASAESLTAGLFAATVAEVPGVSAVLRGGVIVYATDLKATLGGVPAEVLDRFGPVHAQTAAALAQGARAQCRADWGVGLTGVAGPGEQDGVAVGTVFIGIAGPTTDRLLALNLGGDRAQVRAAAVTAALRATAEQVNGS